MSVLKPRNRLVYFRVSEDEFQSCLRACEAGQARSVSDLARTAILDAVESEANNPARLLHDRLSVLETAMKELDTKLVQLALALKEPRQKET